MLEEALEAARTGQGRLIEIRGEAGIGKTRLVEELYERAPGLAAHPRRLRRLREPRSPTRPGAHCCARSSEPARRTRGARARAPARAGRPPRARALAWLPLLALSLGVDLPPTPEVEVKACSPAPSCSGLGPPPRAAARRGPAGGRGRPPDGRGVLGPPGRRHRRPRAPPWLAVATCRDAEGGFVVPDAEHVLHLGFEGLPFADALRLAEAATEHNPPPPHLVALAAERSGGNPLFLREPPAGRGHRGRGRPPRTRSRPPRWPGSTAWLPPTGHCGAARGRPGPALPGAPLRRCRRRHRAARRRHGWQRVGALIRTPAKAPGASSAVARWGAAYAGLLPATRRQLHVIVAALIEREAGDDLSEVAELLSRHYALAGDHRGMDPRVAGDLARARLAYDDAATSYRRAIARRRGARCRGGGSVRRLGGARRGAGPHGRAGRGGRGSCAVPGAWSRRTGAARPSSCSSTHGSPSAPGACPPPSAGRSGACASWTALDRAAARRRRCCRCWRARASARAAWTTRSRSAIRRSRRRRAAGEDAALAQACHILDWALFDAGRAAEATQFARALAIYERLGDLDRQAAVLNNMGGFAYHEGRWDQAVEPLPPRRRGQRARGRRRPTRPSATATSARSWATRATVEAEQRLRRALRIWRGSSYDWGAAFATALLGRTAVRAGRHAEALGLLDDALSRFRRLRAGSDALLVRLPGRGSRSPGIGAGAAGGRRLLPGRGARPRSCTACVGSPSRSSATTTARSTRSRRPSTPRASRTRATSWRSRSMRCWRCGARREPSPAPRARRPAGSLSTSSRCLRRRSRPRRRRGRWADPSGGHRGVAEAPRDLRGDLTVAGADLLARRHAGAGASGAVRQQPPRRPARGVPSAFQSNVPTCGEVAPLFVTKGTGEPEAHLEERLRRCWRRRSSASCRS